MDNKVFNKVSEYSYIIISAIVALAVLIIVPFFGQSEVEIMAQFPTSRIGWFIWGLTRGCVILLNIEMLIAMIKQGKELAKKTSEFAEANKLLTLIKTTDKAPISPIKWERKTFIKRSCTQIVTSAATLIGFGSMILDFDLKMFLTYLVTIITGLIISVFAMKNSEQMWSEGYLEYAKYIYEQNKIKEADNA